MILLLSFLSGTAGLIYEVLWARSLALVFGSTALAQTAVLAVFLGGLSAGSAALGRRADRAASAAKFYARLEFGTAALGIIAPLLLSFDGLWVRWPAVILLLAQAFLMGGTIPALCRAAGGEAQTNVGRVYALNSAGAVAGCLAAAFFLIPALGFDASYISAAALNVLAGLGALFLAAPAASPAAERPRDKAAALDPVVVQCAVFLTGFVALTYEIAWTRVLALVMGSSVYSFAEMLAAFIAGVSAGSLLVAGGPLRRRDPARLLGLAVLGAGVAVLVTLPFYQDLPACFLLLRGRFGDGTAAFYGFEATKFLLCLGPMLAPAICLGATLPLAARIVDHGGSERGEDVGSVFAANAAGNVLGAFVGWLILPWLGVEGLLRSGTTVFVLVGAAILWESSSLPPRRRMIPAAVGLAALLAYRAWLPRWDTRLIDLGFFRPQQSMSRDTFADYRAAMLDMRNMLKTVFLRDDREATVTVSLFNGHWLAMKIDGKTDASNGPDMRTQILLGELPLILKPDARDALLVGWGSGVTAGSLLRHPLAHLDAVELIPAVIDASDCFWTENGGVRRDPRLNLRAQDAKSFLLRDGRLYDAIVSEPSNPWMAGVGDLFSAEFYRRARARLKPGGIMVQWFHAYEMNDALFAMVLRTFRSSFPNVTAWDVDGSDVILVGSQTPLRPSPVGMENAFALPAVRADMARLRIGRLTTLLGLQSAGPGTVRTMAGTGPLNEERRPRLEYGAPLAFFRDDTVTLIRDHDDRGDAPGRAGLLLSRYVGDRGRPLSSDEYLDQALLPHPVYERPLLARWIAEWRRHYPRDPRAVEAERLLKTLGPT